MTEHRSAEERTGEILEAAAQVIEEIGYPKLTMEAVIARTSLSKGGVYRFFSSKRDVALALFRRIIASLADFDMGEVLAWGAPFDETISRLLFAANRPASPASRDRRVWLELLPEVIRDDRFAAERDQMEEAYRAKYQELVWRLMARDGLRPRSDFEARQRTVLDFWDAFVQGMTLRAACGFEQQELFDLVRQFVRIHLQEAVAGPEDE